MGAELKIESAEALELAERLALVMGEPVETAVLDALRKRLRQVEHDLAFNDDDRRRMEADFYALIGGSRGLWKGAQLSLDHGDILYDEYGLPR